MACIDLGGGDDDDGAPLDLLHRKRRRFALTAVYAVSPSRWVRSLYNPLY